MKYLHLKDFLGMYGHVQQCPTRGSKFKDFLTMSTLIRHVKKPWSIGSILRYCWLNSLIWLVSRILGQNIRAWIVENKLRLLIHNHSNFMTTLGWNIAEVAILTQIWFPKPKPWHLFAHFPPRPWEKNDILKKL